MDAIGERLLQRVNALLKTRPDISKADFFRAIGRPTPSWRSEFFAGTRTTNNLRLVMNIARFFGVSVGYVLGEAERALDPGAATLLATWNEADERDRELLLKVAGTLRSRTNGPAADTPDDGGHGPVGQINRGGAAPPRTKRR